ncbi:MAG: hypothetical protein BHV96_05370 [Clostridium sp. CAG:354_28_25]|jgi:integrase|nr:MAG: hypothetical protein BHV96_05370 [Clostridium sp. CAG:354_28_25]
MFKYTTRKDGRLMKRVSVDGKIKTLYSDSPKDLERQYIELKYKSNNGMITNDENMTISVWADKWLETYKADKEQATVKMYKDTIRLYIKPYIGNILLKNLKQTDIVNMLNSLSKKGITRRKDVALLTIKQILDKAVDNDYIYKNVAKSIKQTKHIAKEKQILTDIDISYLQKVAENDSRCFMVLFMLYTGIRREEVAPLLYKDIDIENWTLYVNKAVHWEKNRPEIKGTKGKTSRKIPILEIMQDKVKEMKLNHKDSELVFPSIKSKQLMTETSIRRVLEYTLREINKLYYKDQLDTQKMCQNQNSKEFKAIKFTYHQLRHTYASFLHKAGISIKEAQYLTGHKDVKTLLNIYTHLDEEDKKNATEKLNNLLKV